MSDQQEMTVEGLRALASRYQLNANRCQDVASFLTNQNNNLYWQSEAATSFKQHMQEYLTVLTRFNQSFAALSTELNQRAAIIEESQRNPVVG